MRSRSTTAVLFAASLALAACGAGQEASPGPTTRPPGPGATDPNASHPNTSHPDDPTPTGGWIGGEPKWTDETSGDLSGGGSDSEGAADDMATGVYTAGDPASSPAPPAGEDDGRATTPADQPGGIVPEEGPLRAGSVDDNADFAAYLDYLERIAGLGIELRPLDPTGRIIVEVRGTSDLPAAGTEVVVSTAGTEVARLRTTADGTARFLPALYGQAAATEFGFTAAGATATAAPGSSVRLDVAVPGGAAAQPVPIDVLFLLDATGSMGDEIDRLKSTIDSVAARISALEPAPDVQLAMTLYRDKGDTFVTSTFDFTADVAAFRAAIADVVADGGDDYPEALDEGLAEALAAPSWRDPATTVQLVFLVADAPPQVGRQVPTPYPQSVVDAVGRGVKIFPVASSESDDQAEAVFRQLAQATGGRFVFLTYGAGGAATGGNTDIDRTDYEELALDDLVVRLVTEELVALGGTPPQVPPTTTTPPTNPPGQ